MKSNLFSFVLCLWSISVHAQDFVSLKLRDCETYLTEQRNQIEITLDGIASKNPSADHAVVTGSVGASHLFAAEIPEDLYAEIVYEFNRIVEPEDEEFFTLTFDSLFANLSFTYRHPKGDICSCTVLDGITFAENGDVVSKVKCEETKDYETCKQLQPNILGVYFKSAVLEQEPKSYAVTSHFETLEIKESKVYEFKVSQNELPLFVPTSQLGQVGRARFFQMKFDYQKFSCSCATDFDGSLKCMNE